jgi:UDP:flavonoid glycosyltransferase YjiC (YdhE family)
VAIRLKARGHRPVLATCPFHRPLVERAGVEFAPLRPDVDPNATDTIRRVMDARRGSEVVIRELVVPALEQQYEDVRSILPGADLVVSHPVTFAARIAAEEAGVRWMSTILSPLSFFSVSDFPVLPAAPLGGLPRLGAWAGRLFRAIVRRSTQRWVQPIEEFRRRHGLPGAGHPLLEGQFSPDGTLALFSKVLGEPQPDWPPDSRVTGFVWYNGPDASLTNELRRFLDDGDAPVVFTLGSSAVGAAGSFYEVSARAAARLGRRAVLLVGRDPGNRPQRLGPDMLAIESAPHELLFPRAAVTVHHGGVGTTGQALRAGHPSLIVPFAHDQPDNAHRVARLGAGRVVYPRRYTVNRVTEELRALLTEPRYASSATLAARRMLGEQGAEAACDLLVAKASELMQHTHSATEEAQ